MLIPELIWSAGAQITHDVLCTCIMSSCCWIQNCIPVMVICLLSNTLSRIGFIIGIYAAKRCPPHKPVISFGWVQFMAYLLLKSSESQPFLFINSFFDNNHHIFQHFPIQAMLGLRLYVVYHREGWQWDWYNVAMLCVVKTYSFLKIILTILFATWLLQ